ncbi:hypothetical protein R3P38DRAFT_3219185 [Favolaschia claudopus]|uniref:Uncharacterized protein n=1 Tax=Favolaschia claudopus TaxID=2862362 RepID=A0AAW0A414_9AGAR
MLSLRFQESSPSLLSYWSDNMSVGPNLPLHTLSKPAIRYLYQSQVKKFIKANENRPLSEEMVAIFESYLGYKYISSATKCMIADHLLERLESLGAHDCLSAKEMVCRYSPSLVEALDSPFNSPLSRSVHPFRGIAASKLEDWVMETQTDLLEALKYCSFAYRHCLPAYDQESLVYQIAKRFRLLSDDSLLSFMNSGLSLILNIHDSSARSVVFAAIFERASVEDSPPEIQAVTLDIFTSYVGSGPDFSRQLLEVVALAGSNGRTRISIMKSLAVDQNLVPDLLQNAACVYEAASVIMIDLKLHVFLVKLLLDTTPTFSSSRCAALRVLSEICAWSDGAEAVVFQISMLMAFEKLLGWKETETVATCQLLQAIAHHKSTYHSILSTKLIKQLSRLLRDTTPAIFQRASLQVLHKFCIWPEGAETVALKSDVLRTAKKLLESTDTSFEACYWLKVIAHHKSTYHAILSADLIEPLLGLLNEDGSKKSHNEMSASIGVLRNVATWADGAQAIARFIIPVLRHETHLQHLSSAQKFLLHLARSRAPTDVPTCCLPPSSTIRLPLSTGPICEAGALESRYTFFGAPLRTPTILKTSWSRKNGLATGQNLYRYGYGALFDLVAIPGSVTQNSENYLLNRVGNTTTLATNTLANSRLASTSLSSLPPQRTPVLLNSALSYTSTHSDVTAEDQLKRI